MTKPRFPKESSNARWTSDEVAALTAAAEKLLKDTSHAAKPKQAAHKLCEDFYGLTKERMRTPAALQAKAAELKLGLPANVNTALQQYRNTAGKKAPPPIEGERPPRARAERRTPRAHPARGARGGRRRPRLGRGAGADPARADGGVR